MNTNKKTYQAKLFVRYAGSNNYVLYSTNDDADAGVFDTSAEKSFSFSETLLRVGYLFHHPIADSSCFCAECATNLE